MNKVHKINGFVYVTSKEEVKKVSDHVVVYEKGIIEVLMYNKYILFFVNGTKALRSFCEKIILTNDPKLNQVQQLTKEEVDYCLSCEDVEIKECHDYEFNMFGYYKIIIQQVEPKQEILKENKIK